MTRPSHNTDVRLIEAGRRLFTKKGLLGLNVREVAKEAGVNLGMFHYHFKTKDAYIRRVLSEIYEEFFKSFTVALEKGTTEEKIKAAIFRLAQFVRDNRELVISLIHGVIERHKTVTEFLNENLSRHANVLGALILEGQRKGEIKKVPIPMAMSMLGGSIVLPSLMIGMMERAGAKKPLQVPIEKVREAILPDEMIQIRLEIVMKGLKQ